MKFTEKYAHLIKIVENWDDSAEEYFGLSNIWKKPTRNTPDLYTVRSLNNPQCFRLRPEPKLVEFGPDDIKPGMVFRTCGSTDWYPFDGVSRSTVRVDGSWISFSDLRRNLEWSTDGVTWNRCEKEAAQ